MPKREREHTEGKGNGAVARPVREGVKAPVTREFVHSLRGRFKGKGLLKALMTEKEKERSA
jgi:hypothetical protein